MAAALTPLPSVIQASAWDAANARMRKAGRSKWTRGDYNEACRTQERLTRACYAKATDDDGDLCYIRFQIAMQMERARTFTLKSDMKQIHRMIDEALAA